MAYPASTVTTTLAPASRQVGRQVSPRVSTRVITRTLTRGLAFAVALALIGPPAAAEQNADLADCAAQAPAAPLMTPDTGALVLRAALRAYTPVATRLAPARATLHGGDSFTGTVTSSAQCAELIIFPRLAPGRYRLASVEGRVNAFTAQRGFLFEMPQDGYRIIAPRGDPGTRVLYRVPLPRDPEYLVQIAPGEVRHLGVLRLDAQPGRRFGVQPRLDAAPPTAPLREWLARQYPGLPAVC